MDASKFLFLAIEHGRLSFERPPKGMKDVIIAIIKKNLEIKSKKTGEIKKIPLKHIELAERIDSSKISSSSIVATFLIGTPPTRERKIYTKIIAKKRKPFYITFQSYWSGWQTDLHDEFYSILKSQIKKIQKEEEIAKLKEIQKTIDIIYMNIPSQTRLTALKCPNCQAPLEFMPPCTCEYCGVMIELMKRK
ncbi:MAG: hypothetical protein ACTSR3_13690 [Candidatus Helarchaeota archaeon]